MNRAQTRRHSAMRILHGLVAASVLSAGIAPRLTWAASWPEKSITILVPYAAGGGTDALARLLAAELGGLLHQTVIVDNKPGARGAIAYQALIRSGNDGGYTFLLDNSSFAIQPLYKGLPYDPVSAFSPVARMTISPTVLLIGKDVPAHSFQEFIALVKKSPGKIAFASYGVGTSSHLAGELLNTLASINMLHVPYKGSGPALTDLLGGQVQAMFSDPLSAKQLVDTGKVRAIAISGYERWKAYPDTPTYRELGLDQLSAPGWWGVIASSKTPRSVIEKMAEAINKVLASAVVRSKIRELGAEVSPLGPDAFAEFLKTDTNRWVNVVRAGKIDMDAGMR